MGDLPAQPWPKFTVPDHHDSALNSAHVGGHSRRARDSVKA